MIPSDWESVGLMVIASWSRSVAWMRATPLTSGGVAKQIMVARLRWLRSAPPSEKLEQVGGQADQRPLRSYLVVAAEGEAAKGPALLGLAKDRLDDRLAARVDLPSFGRAQLLAHPLRDRAPRPRGRRLGASMRVPVRRDVTVDALDGRGGQNCFAGITRLGPHHPKPLAGGGLHPGRPGHERADLE